MQMQLKNITTLCLLEGARCMLSGREARLALSSPRTCTLYNVLTQVRARLTIVAGPIWPESSQLHTWHNILPSLLPPTFVADGTLKTWFTPPQNATSAHRWPHALATERLQNLRYYEACPTIQVWRSQHPRLRRKSAHAWTHTHRPTTKPPCMCGRVNECVLTTECVRHSVCATVCVP